MLQAKWLAALVATGALCTAAGISIGKAYSSNRRSTTTTTAVADGQSAEQLIAELQKEVERQKKLRAQERSGRTNAERVCAVLSLLIIACMAFANPLHRYAANCRYVCVVQEAREAIQQEQEANGYNFDGIAHVQSCFAERRGTPRQGKLVPDARARIKFRASIPPASLECLDQFTHLWVIFVFHENTNVAKAGAKKASTFPAKIAPPRLGGQKVGLFSTRTPHRPNSIGLTLVKIDAVYGRYIEISGHDLVNGTPVLDVKPYMFADCVPEHVCPEWVSDKVDLERQVEFSVEATQALEAIILQQKSRFYKQFEHIQAAIKQMLVLDIRSVHQGRGHASEDQLFLCRFDNVKIGFRTLEEKILVVQCSYSPVTK